MEAGEPNPNNTAESKQSCLDSNRGGVGRGRGGREVRREGEEGGGEEREEREGSAEEGREASAMRGERGESVVREEGSVCGMGARAG